MVRRLVIGEMSYFVKCEVDHAQKCSCLIPALSASARCRVKSGTFDSWSVV